MATPKLFNVVAVTVPTTATAYEANDCVGGILTLTGALNAARGTGRLVSLGVTDADNQKAVLEVLLFNASPSGGTYTDEIALALHANDLAKFLGKVQIPAANYLTVGSHAAGGVNNVQLAVEASSGGTLYALVMTTGTPTYASTSSLKLVFGFEQD